MPLDTEIELPTAADTEALGERLAAGLGAGDLVVLAGPLGAGKTVLVRGLARGLGVAGAVTSPTFVIAREHRPRPRRRGAAGARRRLPARRRRAELDDLDLDTDLAEAVVAVEWGEGVAERLAERHLLVRLDRRPDDVRTAVVTRVAARPSGSSPSRCKLVRAVLVLALDTATPAVTAGVVELTADGCVQRSVRVAHDARKHAELLMPGIVAACDEAGVALADLAAVVTGVGPGPFTGLRVGMVTAAALGDALGIPVHGVCSLDAIAHGLGARRSWSPTPAAARSTGPPTTTTAAAPTARTSTRPPRCSSGCPSVRAAAGGSAEVTGLPVVGPAAPSPAGLVAVAAAALRAGVVPGPLEPLYLRRPDAQEPGARKRVTA